MLNHRANYKVSWLDSVARLMKHFVDAGPTQYAPDFSATQVNIALRKLHDRASSPRGKGKYKGHPVWSRRALDILESHNGAISKATKQLAHEHVVPLDYLVRSIVLTTPCNTSLGVYKRYIDDYAAVVIITRTEDSLLHETGLASKMPANWKPGDDIWARYKNSGLYDYLVGA